MAKKKKKSALELTEHAFLNDPSLPIEVHIRDPHPVFPLHSHTFDELVIVFKGTALHEVDGQAFPIKAGDVFVITGSRQHQYRDMTNLVLTNVLFDMEKLHMEDWDIRSLPGFHALFSLEPTLRAQHQFQSRLRLSDRQLDHANELVMALASETSSRSPGYRVMARGVFMQLVVFLSRCYSATPGTESLDILRLGDAIAHMEQHFSEGVSLEDLADKAHMSKRHFQRVFQTCTGTSPIAYLLGVRLRNAAELLRSTTREITDIAFACGFRDGNYFTRCFRKHMGTTPKVYRDAH